MSLLPRWLNDKESYLPMQELQETCFQFLCWKDTLLEVMATHSNILAVIIPWPESLVGYSPWDCKQSDMTEWLSTHAHNIWVTECFLHSKLLSPWKYPINCFVNKLCLTLCNPMDHSLLGFSFHGISQARMLLLFSRSVMSDSLQPHVNAAYQGSWSSTISQSLLKHMSIELMMPSNHLIFCHPLLMLSIFPSIRIFSKELVLHIRWPKY